MKVNNNRGSITLDFIFSAMMFFGFTTVLTSFILTFSVVEVIQYISFMSARNYSLSHLDIESQIERGESKYQELIGSIALAPLLENEWYSVENIELSDFNDDMAVEKDYSRDSKTFSGARIQFSAPILYKQLPFLGSTGDSENGFIARIQSFTSREPNASECSAFNEQRLEVIQNSLGYRGVLGQYIPQSDNGC